MLLYRLVCVTGLCFEQTFRIEKIYSVITGFYFYCVAYKNNYVSKYSKSMSEKTSEGSGLSNETWRITKSIACLIITVKLCAATSTVLDQL
jgi:hypothetical protein